MSKNAVKFDSLASTILLEFDCQHNGVNNFCGSIMNNVKCEKNLGEYFGEFFFDNIYIFQRFNLMRLSAVCSLENLSSVIPRTSLIRTSSEQ